MAISDRIEHVADRVIDYSLSNSNFNSKSKAWTGNSIRTKTQDLIMQFPLLISDQVTVKTAQILAEGFERENAMLVKLLLQNDLGSLTDGENGLTTGNILKQIHTNIDSSVFHENLVKENISQLVPIDDKFNQFSLNERTLPKYFREDRNEVVNTTTVTMRPEDVPDDVVQTTVTMVGKEFTTGTPQHNSFDPKLFDKINKLAPTFIEMEIHKAEWKTGRLNGDIIGDDRKTKDVKIAFGVKCVAHPLKSDDIINNVRSSFQDSTMFKLVKWTTGEYGFLKGIGEIVFDVTRMKNLGIQASKTSNYWWFKLRKLKNSTRSKFFSKSAKNAPIKTATLILTKEEIETINNQYRIDLKQVRPAYKLLNDLFLLNFGYIDETTETVYIFDEVSRSYIVKDLDAFKNKTKDKTINIDDIKSLFGR